MLYSVKINSELIVVAQNPIDAKRIAIDNAKKHLSLKYEKDDMQVVIIDKASQLSLPWDDDCLPYVDKNVNDNYSIKEILDEAL